MNEPTLTDAERRGLLELAYSYAFPKDDADPRPEWSALEGYVDHIKAAAVDRERAKHSTDASGPDRGFASMCARCGRGLVSVGEWCCGDFTPDNLDHDDALVAIHRDQAEHERATRLALVAKIEGIIDPMGDPMDPKHLHPQAASLIFQLRALLAADDPDEIHPSVQWVADAIAAAVSADDTESKR